MAPPRCEWPVSYRHLENPVSFAVVLEIAQPVIARDRRALHPARLPRVVTAHAMKHSPVVPDHHVRGLPLVKVRPHLRDNLLANGFEQSVALRILAMFDARRH